MAADGDGDDDDILEGGNAAHSRSSKDVKLRFWALKRLVTLNSAGVGEVVVAVVGRPFPPSCVDEDDAEVPPPPLPFPFWLGEQNRWLRTSLSSSSCMCTLSTLSRVASLFSCRSSSDAVGAVKTRVVAVPLIGATVLEVAVDGDVCTNM